MQLDFICNCVLFRKKRGLRLPTIFFPFHKGFFSLLPLKNLQFQENDELWNETGVTEEESFLVLYPEKTRKDRFIFYNLTKKD